METIRKDFELANKKKSLDFEIIDYSDILQNNNKQIEVVNIRIF